MHLLNKKDVIILIHGAYQSPWMWCSVIDDILLRKNLDYILVSLPGYYRGDNKDTYLSEISERVGHKYNTVYIVGHSLGAAVACYLIKYMKSDEIIIFLSSVPIDIPKIYLDMRVFIEKILMKILVFIPADFLPIFIRSKIITKYSDNKLLYILSRTDEYIDYIYRYKSNIKSINIGCGSLDLISGSIKKQRKLVGSIENAGIKCNFQNFGFTSHYPHIFNRKKYVKWIMREIDENEF